MKAINFYKKDGIVTVTLELNNGPFNTNVLEEQFAKWEKLSKEEYYQEIPDSEQETFLETVDANDGDFYTARRKWPILKKIEQHPKDFLIQAQQFFINH